MPKTVAIIRWGLDGVKCNLGVVLEWFRRSDMKLLIKSLISDLEWFWSALARMS